MSCTIIVIIIIRIIVNNNVCYKGWSGSRGSSRCKLSRQRSVRTIIIWSKTTTFERIIIVRRPAAVSCNKWRWLSTHARPTVAASVTGERVAAVTFRLITYTSYRWRAGATINKIIIIIIIIFFTPVERAVITPTL